MWTIALPAEVTSRFNNNNNSSQVSRQLVWRRLALWRLHWFIDSRKRLIVVTAEGPVTRADIDGLLDAVTGAKALAYRKLVDATAGKFAMSAVDLLAIGAG